MRRAQRRQAKPYVLAMFVVLLSTLLFSAPFFPWGSRSSAQGPGWGQAISVSHVESQGLPGSANAWFPDIAIDQSGWVHVVWCQTTRNVDGAPAEDSTGLAERLYYSVGNGRSWSMPNDIVPPNREIIRNALVVDSQDVLHVVYRFRMVGLGGTGIYYSSASAELAQLASAWTPKRLVSPVGRSYAADVEVDDEGVLHVVLDDEGALESEECPACADIYYRQSTDNGQTWSPAINLSRTLIGSNRGQIELAPNGTLHATWDEGWDRLSGQGRPIYSAYSRSDDGGDTWLQPIHVTYPAAGTAQLAAGADGRGGVMLVWRTVVPEHNRIYYQWSTDEGETWDRPKEVPDVFARPWTEPYDMYDMATDRAGRIHLVYVGRRTARLDDQLGVYHLVWDGGSWSAAELVHQGPDSPEYPKILISDDDQLHVAWFTRPEIYVQAGYDVWYARDLSQAGPEIPLPSPVATRSIPTPSVDTDITLEVTVPVSGLVLTPGESGLPDGLYGEGDDLLHIALGLSPIVLIIVLLAIVRRLRRR